MAMEMWRVIECAHEMPIMCTAYNRARKELYSGSQDALIKCWDIESGRLVRTQVAHRGWLTDMIYIDEVAMLISASADGRVIVWSDRGKELQALDFYNGGPAFCLAWNYKRSQVVVGGEGVVGIFKLTKPDSTDMAVIAAQRFQASLPPSRAVKSETLGMPLPSELLGEGGGTPDALKVLRPLGTPVHCHGDIVRGVCCSDTGRIYSAGYDKAICIIDSERLKDVPSVEMKTKFEKCHSGAICSVAFDTDNNWLVTGSYDGAVKIWSKEGHCLDEFARLNDTVTGVCYVPSTKNYWLTNSRQLVAYDPLSPQDITDYIRESSRFDAHRIARLHQTPSDSLVIGITVAKGLVVWRYNPWAAHRVLSGHADWCEALVTFVRAGERGIFSGGADGVIIRWEPSANLCTDVYTVAEEMVALPSAVLVIIYSSELDALVCGTEDGAIRIKELKGSFGSDESDAEKAERLAKASGAEAAARAAKGGSDLSSNAASSSIGAGLGPSAPNKAKSVALFGHEGRVVGLACTNDHVLASVGQDASLRFWDLHQLGAGTPPLRIIEKAHDEPILGLAFAKDRDELATCAAEAVVKIWEVSRPQHASHVASLVGHTAEVTAVQYCDWKDMWVTASEDETIKLWSAADRCLVRSFRYLGESCTCLMLDGAHGALLAAMADFQLRVYDVDQLLVSTGEAVLPLRKHVGHTEPIRSICYVASKQQYLTASWDKTVRVWTIPPEADRPEPHVAKARRVSVTGEDIGEDGDAVGDDVVNPEAGAAMAAAGDPGEFVSAYALEHPLVKPKALTANTSADFASKLAKGHHSLVSQVRDIDDEPPKTNLGARLQEKEEELQRKHYSDAASRSPHPKHRSRGVRSHGRASLTGGERTGGTQTAKDHS